SIDNIRTVLEDIRVERIDHGTNIVEDPELVAMAKERGLGFTCCPVSNSFVTEQMKADEIVSLLRAGLRVTINSDDPAYFGAYVGDNYIALAEQAGLSHTELVQLAINSFEASWLTPERRAAYIDRVKDYAADRGVALPS
ncbi:MAG TPA: adenosine deaminase, partial [Microbacterium sp.]|nr:adenosine deaminase [Microbacterium sp.]